MTKLCEECSEPVEDAKDAICNDCFYDRHCALCGTETAHLSDDSDYGKLCAHCVERTRTPRWCNDPQPFGVQP